MKIVNLTQGSAEWKNHRANHFNASDAPAMLGISPYKSRSQLLKEYATGITPDVDDATQRRFNDGHRFEALARPLAEKIIGDELSPITGVAEDKYSASFDGITFSQDIIWEHKSMNDGLRVVECTNDIPEVYCVQMEHQLLVSGAEKCLFSATKWDENDNLVEERHAFYYPQMDLRARIVEGWKQFAKDLAEYSPAAEAEKVTAVAVIALPSLSVTIKGEVTNSNLPVFINEADKFLAGIKTALETDQDFADAESNVKACKAAEDGIEASKKAITAQATSIDEVMRTMDLYKEKLSTVRLKLDRLVKSEKEARKAAIISKAKTAYQDYINELYLETKPIELNVQWPDFAGAIKGLKTLTSMQEKVDTALRDGKFAAEQVAKDVRAKLAWCKTNAAGQSALFPDLQALMTKPMEDFTLTITSRIEKARADEAARLEAQREKIEAEAKTKAEAEAAAKMAQEEARIRTEEQAKARATIEAEAKTAGNTVPSLDDVLTATAPAEIAQAIATCGSPATVDASNPVAFDAAKPGDKIVFPVSQPSRESLIKCIAFEFGVEIETAEAWLLATFGKAERKGIEMQPVESSQIAAIGHDPATNTLAIQFSSKTGTGSVYHYSNFTAADFEAFRTAKSPGKHFGEFIKPCIDKYPYVKAKAAQQA